MMANNGKATCHGLAKEAPRVMKTTLRAERFFGTPKSKLNRQNHSLKHAAQSMAVTTH